MQVHFRLLPGKPYELTYNLFPLVAGHVSLPKLHLNMLRYSGTMDAIVQKMLPSHIFIKVHTARGTTVERDIGTVVTVFLKIWALGFDYIEILYKNSFL